MAEKKEEESSEEKKQPPVKEQEKSRLPQEFQHILELIPETERESATKSLVALIISKRSTFSGPIPPPEILKGYNDVVDNGADRILSMAERQSEHRIKLEDFSIREEHRQSSKGQNLGFGIAVIALGISALLTWLGHDWVAGIIGGSTIIGLVSVFVIGKRGQEQNLEQKDP